MNCKWKVCGLAVAFSFQPSPFSFVLHSCILPQVFFTCGDPSGGRTAFVAVFISPQLTIITPSSRYVRRN